MTSGDYDFDENYLDQQKKDLRQQSTEDKCQQYSRQIPSLNRDSGLVLQE
jgi:hypothetical protein